MELLNVWEDIAGKMIIGLIILIVSAIVFLIRRLFLGSESKELENILGYFGHFGIIEYNIKQKEATGTQTIKESFNPKELSLFIKRKHQESKKWKGRELELAKEIKSNSFGSETIISELKDVSYKGLCLKCPTNWIVETIEVKNFEIDAISNTHPEIRCKSGDGKFFTLKVESTSVNPKNLIISDTNEIKKLTKKFIHSLYKPFDFKKKESCYSCGYAYKLEGNNRFGFVMAYQFDSYHIVAFTATCTDDWSFLCSDLLESVLKSIDYK